jgi:dUTPase
MLRTVLVINDPNLIIERRLRLRFGIVVILLLQVQLEWVDELNDEGRGGFGSTGLS